MNEWLRNLVDQIQALPPGRRLVLAAAGLGSLAFLAWVSAGMGQRDWRPLYSGLDPQEAARVTEALRGESIEYQLADGATRILVPASSLYEARIRMASRGLPSGGTSGFELFDAPAFGVTDFVHKVNFTRAIQGELARSIEQLDPVERARVQVVIPERSSVLASAERKPSAAVVVRLASGRRLADDQVQAIVHLVASSVESLRVADVTVVDAAGRLLAPMGDVADGSMAPGGAPEYQREVEAELARRVEAILEPVVGVGGVVARVSAEMDWTESEVTEERFDPDSQVARSEQRSDESERDGASGGVPGVAANAPDLAGGGGEPPPTATRSSEMTNYEISKTVSHRVTPMGRLERLSVAVLVDAGRGVAAEGEGETGEGADAPDAAASPGWSEQELQRFEQLARQAVGYSEERGDQVVVTTAPFRAPEILPDDASPLPPEWVLLGSNALRILAQLVALLLFARLIVKPMLGLVAAPATAESAAGAGRTAGLPAPVSELEAELAAGGAGALALEPPAPAAPLTLAEQVAAEAAVRGEDSISTIRGWLSQG